MRRLAAVVPLALLGLAVMNYVDDLRARAPIREAVSRFTIDVRRPLETEVIGYAPSADIAAQVLAASAISDALGTTRLTNLAPGERRAWLDVPLYVDDELGTALEQSLDAIARNPGWPLHRYFVGKLAYTRDRRSVGADIEPDRWLIPLESAYRFAPGHEPVVETLAGVLLEASRVLPETSRLQLPDVLASAFADPQFVRLAFDVSVDIAGRDEAFRALPDEPSPLLEGVRVLGRRGDIDGATLLHERWEGAEWRARERDLAAMRTRLARGDWRGLVAACATWVSRHQARDFDTPGGARQAEEVLRLWPKDQVGSWNGDRRAELVRFFLAGRAIDPDVLEATVATLAHAPAPVRARVALAAGNESKAESLVRGSGSEGGFEWTDYFVDLARRAIARNDIEGAVEAIGRISPSARRECDVLIVRRQAGEALEPPGIAVTDDSGRILGEAWATNGMLGLCVDPMTAAGRTFHVELETGGPALVEWGLDGGRRDTLPIDGIRQIELPLSGLTGRHVFYAKVLWGKAIIRRTARVE